MSHTQFNKYIMLVKDKKLPRMYNVMQNSADATLNEEDIAVSNVRIDLTRGNNNPLNRYFRLFNYLYGHSHVNYSFHLNLL